MHIFHKYVYTKLNNAAGWSSLEARRAHNPKVVGSNPAPAISFCPDSSVGRAKDWKSLCRWFDSGSGHLSCDRYYIWTSNLIEYGALAQSVEHLTFNQVVRGSNPRCFILENIIQKYGVFLFANLYKTVRTITNLDLERSDNEGKILFFSSLRM